MSPIIPAHRQSFSEERQHKVKTVEQQAQQTLKSSEEYYNQHAHTLQESKLVLTGTDHGYCTNFSICD